MSDEELDRVSVIERVIERRLTQREAARMLGVTSRQVRRLRRVYEQDGRSGLASKWRSGSKKTPDTFAKKVTWRFRKLGWLAMNPRFTG